MKLLLLKNNDGLNNFLNTSNTAPNLLLCSNISEFDHSIEAVYIDYDVLLRKAMNLGDIKENIRKVNLKECENHVNIPLREIVAWKSISEEELYTLVLQWTFSK